jgi:hypothetical protein
MFPFHTTVYIPDNCTSWLYSFVRICCIASEVPFLTAIVLMLLLTLLGHSFILYFIICEEAIVISFQIVFLPDSECFLFLQFLGSYV